MPIGVAYSLMNLVPKGSRRLFTLNNVELFSHLKDVLERMTDGHPMSRLGDLLPWNWPKIPVNC
jgi:IS66 C-terminal element